MRSISLNLNRHILLDCNGHPLELGKQTHIMGILNITPDSFSDGGDFYSFDRAVEHAKLMETQGASIIDIGGESSRPGAIPVDAKEEINRIIPVLKELLQIINLPISVDTYKASVAKEALSVGAHIINDVWGLQKDPELASVVAEFNVPVILMHNQKHPYYEKDIIESIKSFLTTSIEIALKAGVNKEKIILDPGIGFGKTPEQNMLVLSRLSELNNLGFPLLLGTSRKSVIGKVLNLPPQERVEGTIATTVMAIIQGVDIVRVHDVKENYLAAKFTDAIVRKV